MNALQKQRGQTPMNYEGQSCKCATWSGVWLSLWQRRLLQLVAKSNTPGWILFLDSLVRPFFSRCASSVLTPGGWSACCMIQRAFNRGVFSPFRPSLSFGLLRKVLDSLSVGRTNLNDISILDYCGVLVALTIVWRMIHCFMLWRSILS